MTAESPKAPESKARTAWSLDDRHQAFLSDRDGTRGRYDPVEAPPHRHTRHRDAEEKTGDLRRSDPHRSASAGGIQTEDLGAGGGR